MALLKLRAEMPVLGLALGQETTTADSPLIRSMIGNGYLTLLEDPAQQAADGAQEPQETREGGSKSGRRGDAASAREGAAGAGGRAAAGAAAEGRGA